MKPMRAKEAKELLNDIADRIDKIYTLTAKEREAFNQAKLALEKADSQKPILRMNEKKSGIHRICRRAWRMRDTDK